MNVATPNTEIKLKDYKFSYNKLRNTGKDFLALKTFYETSNIFKHLLVNPISAGVFKDDHRKLVNFEYMDWCILDIDEGMEVDEAVHNFFCDQVHIIATSVSHNPPGKHRFRVLRPLKQRIYDLETAKATLRHEVKKYGADKKCGQPAALFCHCKEIISVCEDGYLVDVITPPPSKPFVPTRKYSFSYFTPTVLRTLRADKIPIGQRDFATFQCVRDLSFQGQMEPEEIIEFISNRVTFESKPSDPWGVEQIRDKVNAVLKNGVK